MDSTRREFMRVATAAASFAVLGSIPNLSNAFGRTNNAGKGPNVIFMVTDDQEYHDLGCFGGKALTPNIDKLCGEGIRFDKCFATSSVCTPSRYSCITGNYAARSESLLFMSYNPEGSQSYIHWNTALEKDGQNLPRVLGRNGYVTGMVGKWHLGSDETSIDGGFIANNKRFTQVSAEPGHKMADFNNPAVQTALKKNYSEMKKLVQECGFDCVDRLYWDNPEGFAVNGLDYNMEWLTEGALNFIDKNHKKPFYLHFCTTAPHGPWNDLLKIDPLATPAGRIDKLPDIIPPRESIYKRLKEVGLSPEDHLKAHNLWLDDCIGAIMQKLRHYGIEENTLIVYVSDNGRREKGFLYKGGVGVPAFLRWQAGIKGGQVCDEAVGNIDFAPTIFDACGVADYKVDGRSLLPLAGGKDVKWRDYLFLDIGATKGVVSKDWKYIAFRYPDDMEQRMKEKRVYCKGHGGFLWIEEYLVKDHPDYWQPDQLYNIANDPGEKENLAQFPQYGGKLKEMKQALAKYIVSFKRPFGEFGSDKK